jgi:hypothetical protein
MAQDPAACTMVSTPSCHKGIFCMLYAILCYDREAIVESWTKAEEEAAMARLGAVLDALAGQGRLGAVARLAATAAAVTVRKGAEPLVTDGPFAETKEQLLGFYLIDCAGREEAVAAAQELARASGTAGAFEIRPLRAFRAGPAGA